MLPLGCSKQHEEGYYDGECEDGKDNDDDGAVDCRDTDCRGTGPCIGVDTSESDADADADADSDGDADVLTPDDMPESPIPFNVSVSGVYSGTLAFDKGECSQLGNNFRQTWRNEGRTHVFVLIADIVGVYAGPGDYDASMGRVGVKLQEEAGGYGYFFQTDASDGDPLTITIEYCDDDIAWGHFDVSTMSSEKGAVTVSPGSLPIWCENVENADE
jgi:hypothetical protein